MTKRDSSRKPARIVGGGAREDEDRTATQQFLVALSAFREDSGRPTYRTLVRISRGLRTNYSLPQDVHCSLVEMSLSALSEILSGKRKRLPTFDWTASFVLSCQRSAVEKRIIKHDPGTTILVAWSAILAEHAAFTGRRPPQPAGNADPSCAAQPAAYQLPPDQQEFIAGHGAHGLVLLGRAQHGHPDARYRVALLLAADQERTADAESLLIQVAATGHAPSLDLLDANPEHLSPRAAAERAHHLARMAQARGADSEALAFFRAAARGGIADAALEAAQILIARDSDREVTAWLADLITKPAAGRHRHDQP